MHPLDDTIVAVSSAPGRSPRALIRCSGPQTPNITRGLLSPSDYQPRSLQRVTLQPPLPPLPALALRFTAPHSFTGQDTLELQLSGNPALLTQTLQAFNDSGARPAEPGEFTARAFMLGKLDLTEAEGVAATIAAESAAQLRAAGDLRRGRLANLTDNLADRLATLLALVEAGIDFTDQDDVVPITPADLHTQLTELYNQLEKLLSESQPWSALESLPRVVLAGAPSTGKSTLFNALLDRPRALTDAAPGTTRDRLAEPLQLPAIDHLPPAEVLLIDIAGLDTPTAEFDRDIQSLAQGTLAEADLILRITDGHAPLPNTPTDTPSLILRTKADATPTATKDACGPSLTPDAFADGQPLPVSAHTNRNLDTLRHAIAHALRHRVSHSASDRLTLQPRHQQALAATRDTLQDALTALTPARNRPSLDTPELIALPLRDALDHLAALTGRMTPDDIIGRVFATFCVGK
ncbi:MAG: GTPase [Planctomycetota bacterium]